MKNDEIREVRSSLDKSLRTVEEDANNLRSMLGKSLRKIDRYTDAIRRGDLQSTTETETSANETEIPDGYQRKPHSEKYAKLVKRHARAATAHVDLNDRYSLGRSSPEKMSSSEKYVNYSSVDGTDSGTNGLGSHASSPVRRYRKGRKSAS